MLCKIWSTIEVCSYSVILLASAAEGAVTLTQLAPLEFTGAWPFGMSSLAAGNWLFDKVSKEGFIPGINFKIDGVNNGCHGDTGSAAFIAKVSTGNYFSVGGSFCFLPTKNVAVLAHGMNLPFVSWGSAGPDLSYRKSFPSFFRARVADSKISFAWLRFCEVLGWSHIGMLSGGTFDLNAYHYWNANQQLVQANAASYGVTIAFNVNLINTAASGRAGLDRWREARSNVRTMLASRVRALVVVAIPEQATSFICAAHEGGLRGFVFFSVGWFWANWYTPNFEGSWYPLLALDEDGTPVVDKDGNNVHVCTNEDMMGIADFSYFKFNSQMWAEGSDAEKPLSCTPDFTSKTYRAEMEQMLQTDNGKYIADLTNPQARAMMPELSTTYDGLCLLLLSIRELLSNTSYTTDDVANPSLEVYTNLNSIMQNTQFQGSTGWVRFPDDPQEDFASDPLGGLEISQLQSTNPAWQAGTLTTVARFKVLENGSLGQLRNTGQNQGAQMRWKGGAIGTSAAPPGQFPICLAGHVLQKTIDGTDMICKPCNVGEYQTIDSFGAGVCLACSPGKYSSMSGSTLCELCDAGSYQNDEGQTTCESCAPGTLSRKPGAQDCDDCAPGKFINKNVLPEGSIGAAECMACPRGKFVVEEGSTACDECDLVLPGSQTLSVGSSSSDTCVCQDNSFRDDRGRCTACPQGLNCDWLSYAPRGTLEEQLYAVVNSASGGQSSPRVVSGYFYERQEMYKCLPAAACLGGTWGGESSCSDPRLGFLCQECPEGSYAAESGCMPCRPGDTVGIVIVVICFIVITSVLLVFANARIVTQTKAARTLMLAVGQLLVALQALAAFNMTAIQWGRPFASIIEGLQVLSIDIDIIRMQCGGVDDPVAKYLIKMGVPLLAIVYICLLHVLLKTLRPGVASVDGLLNASGQVGLVLLMSLGLATMTPFHCYDHPSGQRSMISSPQVLCFESDSHQALVIVAIIAIVLYIFGFTAAVVYAVIKYPSSIIKDDIGFTKRYQFLFIRWEPRCHWYSTILILKNVCVVLFPMVLPEADLDICIVLLQVVLFAYLVVTVRVAPWRSSALNWLDWILSAGLCTIMLFGSLSLSGEEMSEGCSLTLTLVFVFMVGIALLVSSKYAYEKVADIVQGSKPFAIFLSHHKVGGACCARYLKTKLSSVVKGNLFFDCDNLDTLGGIFDAVKMSQTVLIILSGETLCRPWCVGEIVTAYYCRITVATCTFGKKQIVDKWLTLTETEMINLYGRFEVLRPHGVALEDVKPAIEGVLRLTPSELHMDDSQRLEGGLVATLKTLMTKSIEGPSERVGSASSFGLRFDDHPPILLLSDKTDPEGCASARLLKIMFQKSIQKTVQLDITLTADEYAKILQGTGAVSTMCLFSAFTLAACEQLARLALYFQIRPKGSVFPVLIGEAFKFPDVSFYEDLKENGGRWGSSNEAWGALTKAAKASITATDVAAAIETCFTSIASFVNVPYANADVLEAQVTSLIVKVNPKIDFDEKGLRCNPKPVNVESSDFFIDVIV